MVNFIVATGLKSGWLNREEAGAVQQANELGK